MDWSGFRDIAFLRVGVATMVKDGRAFTRSCSEYDTSDAQNRMQKSMAEEER
jgi:hypothetical protein